MEDMAEDRDALIHPAFHARRSRIAAARQMQISQATAPALALPGRAAT